MSIMSDLDIERQENGEEAIRDLGLTEEALPPEKDYDRETERIHCRTADSLASQTFSPVREYVRGFLCEGLTILAGAPKSGKSWLALALACAVAEGKTFLGRETLQARVLYLAYEDTLRRLKQRIETVSPIPPVGLDMSTDPIRIQDGLVTALADWKRRYPDTGLIIIDTLGKIKPATGTANPFVSDYQEIASLKALADEHHMAILLIHHLRKRGTKDDSDDDPFEQISGTTGLTAASDGMAVLTRSRGNASAKLVWTGRDTEDGEMALRFCEGLWQIVDRNEALRMAHEDKPIVKAVRAYMAQPGFLCRKRLTYEELKEFAGGMGLMIGLTNNAIHRTLKDAQEGLARFDGIDVALDRRVDQKRGFEMEKRIAHRQIPA